MSIWKPIFQLPGVYVAQLTAFEDSRGSLMELYRTDQLPNRLTPVMAYISYTHTGQTRGPHEHVQQTDVFAFVAGTGKLYLWENRNRVYPRSGVRQPFQLELTAEAPLGVIVPPGVVHAYRCLAGPLVCVNGPNALYRGPNALEEVDEIRWEERPDSPFVLPSASVETIL